MSREHIKAMTLIDPGDSGPESALERLILFDTDGDPILLGGESGIINAKDAYGAKGDGTTDDTAAIQAALNAAGAAGGGQVHLPRGNYLISSGNLTIPAFTTLSGVIGGTRLLQAYWSGINPLLSSSGSLGSNIVLSADVSAGSSTLALATAGLTSGTFLHLGSDLAFAQDALRYKGEIVRIKTIDSPSQVTLYGVTADSYATANAASAKVISFNEGVAVRDLSIVNVAPGVHTAKGLSLRLCRNFRIERVHTEGLDGAGVYLRDCIDGVSHACSHLDHTDNSGSGQYGYGHMLACATQNVVVDSLVARKVRHAFTTDGEDNSRGVVRFCTVSNGIATACTSGAWDTHYNSESILFTGCQAYRCGFFGFQARAKNMRVQGGEASYCEIGVSVFDFAHGLQVVGASFRNIVEQTPASASYGNGARVGAANDVVFLNCIFDNIARRGISIPSACKRLHILGCVFKNCGVAAISGYKSAIATDGSLTNAKSGLLIDGCRFVRDNGVSTAMDYGIKQNSTGWLDGLFSNNIFQSMFLGTISDSGSPVNAVANNTTGPVVN